MKRYYISTDEVLNSGFTFVPYTTAYIMRMRDSIRIDKQGAETEEEIAHAKKKWDTVIAELNTRPHVPNAVEAKGLRQAKAKAQRSR